MELNNKIKKSWFRSLMIVAFTLLGIYSCSTRTQAQSLKTIKYIGIEASFGTRSFQVNSNIAKINKMRAGHEGGSIGVVFGNNVLKTRVRAAGFFYSNGNTPHTQELFEIAAVVNFYPLAAKHPNAKFQPYLSAGANLDNVKFYGKYLADQGSAGAYEPYLGKLSQISATGGVGLEYRVPSRCDMIHLFAEAQFGAPVRLSSSNKAFSGTSLSQCTSFSVGVSFGRKR